MYSIYFNNADDIVHMNVVARRNEIFSSIFLNTRPMRFSDRSGHVLVRQVGGPGIPSAYVPTMRYMVISAFGICNAS